MSETINLSTEIKKQLPVELVDFMQVAGRMAQSRGQGLYLVGGVVRDLLLKRANFDLDLVVEGDAISLARELADIKAGKIITHSRFGTAKIQWDERSVDLATARSETYAESGALPIVKPGTIRDDTVRRDFTINAMAVELNPKRYGRLLDLYGGRSDLDHKLIRVLHEKSFVDDATRIWRAIRYEQRLDFQIESDTLARLKHGIKYLDTISGDRIRHELELILKEDCPEKVLRRADELRVLVKLCPALRVGSWLAGRFAQAREMGLPDKPSLGLYLSLLAYPLTSEEAEDLISYLRLRKSIAQVLRDAIDLKNRLNLLYSPELAPSGIYCLLHGHSSTAITASLLTSESEKARERISLFLHKLRYVRPALTGEDLVRMSVTPGPRIGEILNLLRNARLDGKVSSKKDEEEMVFGVVTGDR